MAKIDLYNKNFTYPVHVTRELYSNVGSGINYLGDVLRAFKGATDFEIWDSPTGGTQLAEGVDYNLVNQDTKMSSEAGYNVYTRYQIINATYQTGNIYITYKIIMSAIDANFINYIYQELIKRLPVITTDTMYEIGTGGDFSDLQTAINALCGYTIYGDKTVTLKLITGFSPVNVVQLHPQGNNILIDFNGFTYEVSTGTAFTAGAGCVLRLTNTGANMKIRTLDNGVDYGVFTRENGVIKVEQASATITVGESGKGFRMGVRPERGGRIIAPYLIIEYSTQDGIFGNAGGYMFMNLGVSRHNGSQGLNFTRHSSFEGAGIILNNNGTYGAGCTDKSSMDLTDCNIYSNSSGGFRADDSGFIQRTGATGAQATNSSPALDTLSADGSYVD